MPTMGKLWNYHNTSLHDSSTGKVLLNKNIEATTGNNNSYKGNKTSVKPEDVQALMEKGIQQALSNLKKRKHKEDDYCIEIETKDTKKIQSRCLVACG